ncbi:MAG TPA: hypothetical protein PLA80_11945 [Synergistaceae bacterium]|nr:hypothetical protein [Synergistaceae bacterium]
MTSMGGVFFMPKARAAITPESLQRLVDTLLLRSRDFSPFADAPFIKVSELDEICGISWEEECESPEEEQRRRNVVYARRSRCLRRLRERHHIDLRYDRTIQCYVLQDFSSFLVNVNLAVSPRMFRMLGAGSQLLEHLMPHLAPLEEPFLPHMGELSHLRFYEEGRREAAWFSREIPESCPREDKYEIFSLLEQAIREKRTISFSHVLRDEEGREQIEVVESYSPWEISWSDPLCPFAEAPLFSFLEKCHIFTTPPSLENPLDSSVEEPLHEVIFSCDASLMEKAPELCIPVVEEGCDGRVFFGAVISDLEAFASLVFAHSPHLQVHQCRSGRGDAIYRLKEFLAEKAFLSPGLLGRELMKKLLVDAGCTEETLEVCIRILWESIRSELDTDTSSRCREILDSLPAGAGEEFWRSGLF